MAGACSVERRIQYDLRELEKNPIANVHAVPVNGNLQSWSVNMVAATGEWAGVPFHLHIDIPSSYPARPPKCSLMTELEHPNVFNDYICLDMIKVSKVHGSYEGGQGKKRCKPGLATDVLFVVPSLMLQPVQMQTAKTLQHQIQSLHVREESQSKSLTTACSSLSRILKRTVNHTKGGVVPTQSHHFSYSSTGSYSWMTPLTKNMAAP